MNCTPERKDKCNLVVIASTVSLSDDSEEVVRWCSHCGAIVVDMDYDDRTNPGYYKPVQFPEIAKTK